MATPPQYPALRLGGVAGVKRSDAVDKCAIARRVVEDCDPGTRPRSTACTSRFENTSAPCPLRE
jgi:hypothetical protein